MLWIYFILLGIIQCDSIWNKNYLTWSLVNGTNFSFLNDVITMWNVAPLEFARVEPGKGDINIYFAPMEKDYVLGYASFPHDGSIFINDNLSPNDIFYVLQHEFGHALGLSHENVTNSVMFPFYSRFNTSNYDRENLHKLYKCNFDSVAVINYYTYLTFSGSFYNRLDFNTMDVSSDKLWLPFLRNVDAMYRDENGSYILISNDMFYEFDDYLNVKNYNSLSFLFPDVQFVDAVLKLRNHSLYVFSNQFVNNKYIAELFYPYPNLPLRGAYENTDGYIFLVDKNYEWMYDKNFKFIRKELLCKHHSKLHCCFNN